MTGGYFLKNNDRGHFTLLHRPSVLGKYVNTILIYYILYEPAGAVEAIALQNGEPSHTGVLSFASSTVTVKDIVAVSVSAAEDVALNIDEDRSQRKLWLSCLHIATEKVISESMQDNFVPVTPVSC